MQRSIISICVGCWLAVGPHSRGILVGAERTILSPQTWDEYAPQGKEVDCIDGDIVLRNDHLIAVIANPIAGRNANMTVRNVHGAVIDLTERTAPNDQLSAFYPGAATYALREHASSAGIDYSQTERRAVVSYECSAPATDGMPEVHVQYQLRDGEPFLAVTTTYTNRHPQPIDVEPLDSIRADRGFRFGRDNQQRLFWAYDDWWSQAYGVLLDDHDIGFVADSLEKNRPVLNYAQNGSTKYTLASGQSHAVRVRLIPARNLLRLLGTVGQLRGDRVHPCELRVADYSGPVRDARVTVDLPSGQNYGEGTTDASGSIQFGIPEGDFRISFSAIGRPKESFTIRSQGPIALGMQMDLPSFVYGAITDDQGNPIPCKVEFRGRGGTPDPFFGPDTMIFGVRNLQYTPNGQFRTPIAPGAYDVIVSHGNEYDAVFTSISVERGQDVSVTAQLRRSVDTTGWISTDFHSHSTPSGDNTTSQRGRVLNLLAAHIEFAPCTEHNRVTNYMEHLRHFQAEKLLATCPGIELTGSPLPVNHQNAFPLVQRPRTQDGGAPLTDVDPVVQIERLALWDSRAEKLVQENHPNLVQILGDRDEDGKPDGGFAKMFGYMDVVEVHPPQLILQDPKTVSGDWRNTIFRWMQLLNLGYRIPGVVNTDAHYNFHGSGWLRNYLKCSTDDPAQIQVSEMVKESERGHVVMSNGPFLEVNARSGNASAIPGDELAVTDHQLELKIRVQCANWLDVNRVQVFLNGRPAEQWNFTRVSRPEKFPPGVVKFEDRLTLRLNSDTHIIVVAAGDGLKLGPVMGPEHGEDMPVAVSNPIFADVDGNGFQPNRDLLDEPLPIEGGAPANPQAAATSP
jgi:hypothetical protein